MGEVKERLLIRGLPTGVCSMCGRRPDEDTPRLDVTVLMDGVERKATFCRWCLTEHAPDTLAEIERP